MAIRKEVVWTVAEDGLSFLPTAPQFGGVQGEDNAVAVKFVLGTDHRLVDDGEYTLYIECEDSTGAYDKTEPLTPDAEGAIKALVPLAWTQHGGTIRLNVVAEGVEPDKVILESVQLYFRNRTGLTRRMQALIQTHIQKLLDTAAAMLKSAEDVLGRATNSANSASGSAHDSWIRAQAAADSAAAAATSAESAEGSANTAMAMRNESEVYKTTAKAAAQDAAAAKASAEEAKAAAVESRKMSAQHANQSMGASSEAVNAKKKAEAAADAASQSAEDTAADAEEARRAADAASQSAEDAAVAAEEARKAAAEVGFTVDDVKPFRFTVTQTGKKYTSSATYDEVREVLNAGNRLVICEYNDLELPFAGTISEDLAFYTGAAAVDVRIFLSAYFGVYVQTQDDPVVTIVNVRDYGAVGDGETDDTDAIQEALYEAEASGLPLYIPAGNYLVSQTITTHTRDTEEGKEQQSKALNIYGDGMNTVFTTTEDFEGDYVFYIDVAKAQPRMLWVRDFAIDLVADVSGIYFREIGMKSVVDNLWITHLYDKDPTDTNVRAGIYCHQSTVTTFSRIKVYGNRKHPGQGHENAGIVCEKSYSTKFIDCDIIYNRWAIYLSGGSNNVIDRCRIDENEYGVYQNSSGGAYMDDTRAYPHDGEKFVGTFRNLTIRGNRFESNNKQAIFLCSYGTGGLNYLYNAQITIADNDFSGLGLGRAFQTSARDVFRKAVHLHNCKGVVIENNAFAGMPYEDDLIDVVGNRIVHASAEAIADAKVQKHSQNFAGSNVEDITFRGNVATTKAAVGDNDEHLTDENGDKIHYKTNPAIGADFIADNGLAGFVDDIEVDQSSRSTNIGVALDNIIAIQESLIGGDGE